MGEPIKDPLAPQCGNCGFWDRVPNHPQQGGECCGVPPTPVVVGSRPRQFGNGVDFQVELFRPMMAPNGHPCAHHKPLPVFDLSAGRKGS